MPFCSRCGKEVSEGHSFCPKCGQKLIGFNLEEKQRYVPKPEAPIKERNWFERHLNWTMVLAWVGAYVVNFIIGFMIALSDPYASEVTLLGIGLMIALAILTPVWGWALRKKNRSLWWLPLGLFVPFGFIVLLCLENKSLIHDASGNSIADYNKAIELAPDNADAYYKRGNDYDEVGEYGKAIADYNKAIELRPNHVSAYYNRGCAYGEIGAYGKAIADYNKVTELRPNHALAYYNRGCAYSEIGEYEKAIADYNKTIELDPNDADAYYSRGLAYREKGEVPRSVSDLEKCVGLSTDPELTKAVQQALFEIKRFP